MTLHLPGICIVPAVFLPLGTHHLDPVHKETSVNYRCAYQVSDFVALCYYVPYIDSKVAWGTGDVSSWRQGFGDVLHAEGCGQDPQRKPDHQIALGAFERPAVTWVHIRLPEGKQGKLVL